MCGEKQAIFVSPGGVLRRHDVLKAGSAPSSRARESAARQCQKPTHRLPLSYSRCEVPIGGLDRPLHPRLVGARLVLWKRLDRGDVSQVLLVQLHADEWRLFPSFPQHAQGVVERRTHQTILTCSRNGRCFPSGAHARVTDGPLRVEAHHLILLSVVYENVCETFDDVDRARTQLGPRDDAPELLRRASASRAGGQVIQLSAVSCALC